MASGIPLERLKEIKKISKTFKQHGEKRFRFERILGSGSAGYTLEMAVIEQSESPSTSEPPLRFVMKRALNQSGEDSLRKEIKVLQQLRGAPNIQQLFRIPGETEDLEVSFFHGPTLFTEWIPNGLFDNLVKRRNEWGYPLPNRMLWRFFLCFCYMLVAMAWPPHGEENAPSSKRELPPRDGAGELPPESHLVHGDLNIENVMLGDFEPIIHEFVPMLKLIDFGKSQTIPDSPIPAIKRNMWDIGKIMLALIGGRVWDGRYRSVMIEVTDRGKKRTVRSAARDLEKLDHPLYAAADLKTKMLHQERLDNLDPELKDLIVLCLAPSEADRPELDHLLQEARRNVTEKTQDSYKGKKYYHNESDAELRRISDRIIVLAQSPPLEPL
ncbi:kinase-like domain-containing protein [Hypoxylon sp. NC0597]|nr:kinase-like domain-containing protein [Hypoxylon sp. NC0597]